MTLSWSGVIYAVCFEFLFLCLNTARFRILWKPVTLPVCLGEDNVWPGQAFWLQWGLISTILGSDKLGTRGMMDTCLLPRPGPVFRPPPYTLTKTNLLHFDVAAQIFTSFFVFLYVTLYEFTWLKDYCSKGKNTFKIQECECLYQPILLGSGSDFHLEEFGSWVRTGFFFENLRKTEIIIFLKIKFKILSLNYCNLRQNFSDGSKKSF